MSDLMQATRRQTRRISKAWIVHMRADNAVRSWRRYLRAVRRNDADRRQRANEAAALTATLERLTHV
jgi:hypothetical protein